MLVYPKWPNVLNSMSGQSLGKENAAPRLSWGFHWARVAFQNGTEIWPSIMSEAWAPTSTQLREYPGKQPSSHTTLLIYICNNCNSHTSTQMLSNFFLPSRVCLPTNWRHWAWLWQGAHPCVCTTCTCGTHKCKPALASKFQPLNIKATDVRMQGTTEYQDKYYEMRSGAARKMKDMTTLPGCYPQGEHYVQ